MSEHGTGIEWTHIPGFKGETWNPVVGCEVVSPGCTNCYAMKFAGQRLDGNPKTGHYAGTTMASKAGPVWTGKIGEASEKAFTAPLRWKKPRAVFVNSMGDLFADGVDDRQIARVFAIMALCPQHIFMVLTKRPERMRSFLKHGQAQSLWDFRPNDIGYEIMQQAFTFSRKYYASDDPEAHARRVEAGWPLPNVWLGVSVEDQTRANVRIPDLLRTPAAKRFVSCEPLLGLVDLNLVDVDGDSTLDALRTVTWNHIWETDWKDTTVDEDDWESFLDWFDLPETVDLNKLVHPVLDWVIVGGESGKYARPMQPHWAHDLRDQCEQAATPFFFKQWGEWAPGEHVERKSGIVPTATWFANSWSFGKENLAWTEGHVDNAPDVYRIGKKEAGNHLGQHQYLNWPVTTADACAAS